MKLNSGIKVLLAIAMWALIIAIPQFNLNYTIGLYTGRLKHGEIPLEFYGGIGTGIIVGFIFWGVMALLVKIISALFKTQVKTATVFIVLTSIIFAFMLFTQGETLYTSLSISEEQVRETLQAIEDYKSK